MAVETGWRSADSCGSRQPLQHRIWLAVPHQPPYLKLRQGWGWRSCWWGSGWHWDWHSGWGMLQMAQPRSQGGHCNGGSAHHQGDQSPCAMQCPSRRDPAPHHLSMHMRRPGRGMGSPRATHPRADLHAKPCLEDAPTHKPKRGPEALARWPSSTPGQSPGSGGTNGAGPPWALPQRRGAPCLQPHPSSSASHCLLPSACRSHPHPPCRPTKAPYQKQRQGWYWGSCWRGSRLARGCRWGSRQTELQTMGRGMARCHRDGRRAVAATPQAKGAMPTCPLHAPQLAHSRVSPTPHAREELLMRPLRAHNPSDAHATSTLPKVHGSSHGWLSLGQALPLAL